MRFHFAAIEAVPRPVDLQSSHAVKSERETIVRLKFYRVTVVGESGNSRSKLQTGYYDASSLHQLFGQVSNAESPESTREGDREFEQVVVQFDPATRRHQILQRNQRFTVMFGSNADAVAQQISAFAAADQTGKAIGSLIAATIGREEFESLHSSQTLAKERCNAAKKLATELEAIAHTIRNLDTNMSPDDFAHELRTQLHKALTKGLSAAGASVTLPADLEAATNIAKGAHQALEASK